jgi:hypothetical protein
VLLETLRRLGLSGTELVRAQVGTIRLRLLKIGAVITRRHSGDAGVARGIEDRCSGYTEEASCKEMNTSGDRAKIMQRWG